MIEERFWSRLMDKVKDVIGLSLDEHSNELETLFEKLSKGDNVSVSLNVKLHKAEAGSGVEVTISYTKEKVRETLESFVSLQDELPFDGEEEGAD